MKIRRAFALAILALGALALSACAGPLPEGFSFELESAEAAELEFTAPVEAIGPEAWTIGGLTVAITSATEISGAPQVGDVVKVHATSVLDLGLVAREIEPAPSSAETPDTPQPPAAGEEVEFVGAVVSIAADAWSVGDTLVAITSDTEIKGAIAVGDLVKVHALVQPDLSLVAREIEPAGQDDLDEDEDVDEDVDDDDDELEFKGFVEAIDGESWTVGGVTFLVTSATEVEDLIVVGDYVEIEAVWSVDGLLTAVKVKLEDQHGEGGDLDDDMDDDDDDEDDDEHEDEDEEDDDGDDDHSGSGSD